MSLAILGGSLVLGGIASTLVATAHSGWGAVLAWVTAIALALAAFAGGWRGTLRRLRPSWRWLAVGTLGLLAVGVRLWLSSPARVHGDELITAYFSATEDLSPEGFFSHVPASRGEWVSQFPTPFFLLQRAFFVLGGTDIAAVRLSVQPWVWLVVVLLFVVARQLVDEATAWIAMLLSTFLAFSLYLETLGLHFVSSTAVFLAFFAAGARALRDEQPADAVLTGVLCGACYLFYTSSYVALPLLLAVGLAQLARRRSGAALRQLGMALAGCAVVLAPFVASAAAGYNYFDSRWEQVSLFSGQWSDLPERTARGESAVTIVATHAGRCLLSLVKDGVGGHGGYFFGEIALFDRCTLVLLVAGLAFAVLQARRHPGLLVALAVVAGTFLTGLVLTIPPPAYHRWSVSLPFLALLSALPLRALLDLPRVGQRARRLLVAAAVLLFASCNLAHFDRGSRGETVPQELRLAEYVNSRFAHKKLYMAAFPGYAYNKLAYFADVRRTALAVTGYHSDLLEGFRADEDYLYIIAMPDDFGPRFAALDPRAKLVRFSPQYALVFN